MLLSLWVEASTTGRPSKSIFHEAKQPSAQNGIFDGTCDRIRHSIPKHWICRKVRREGTDQLVGNNIHWLLLLLHNLLLDPF